MFEKMLKLLPGIGLLSIFVVVGVCSLPSINGVTAEQKPATTPEPAAPARMKRTQ